MAQSRLINERADFDAGFDDGGFVDPPIEVAIRRIQKIESLLGILSWIVQNQFFQILDDHLACNKIWELQ